MTRRTEKPRLEWKTVRGKEVPRHRVTWTENGKRRERTITLDWKGDPAELDRLYWQCERGEHPAQKPKAPATSWHALVVAWRSDPRVQRKLSDSTKKSYRRTMGAILEKNADKDVRETTRKHVRDIHDKLAATPRKADHMVQVIRLLWNYGKDKLDWPLGDNPAAGIDLYGKTREFEPWPDWMVNALNTAPHDVRVAAELMLGTGQRPNAAISMQHDDFRGDLMTVWDEKNDEPSEVYCPARLRACVADLPKRGKHLLAKNLTQPKGYDAVEKKFRAWRETLGEAAKPFTLHGLRKLAIIQLAEAGCSDAEIQAVTNQSAEMVAYYRKRADRKRLSRNAQNRRDQNKNGT
ncbi:Phage related integrase [Rhodovulum sp. P5]|uniref:tyrosine-type recombinase/integrase n=1 Tax=Rhodovulum sp. P5 TaxID=1564506 RepID=UPI0009C31A7B|nr:tyrosine-type recombinase/integrase [Rhodovulum sp. P5]ARE38319.1 Phage related integrase [Rhodovulum sp. P5]